MAMIDIDPLALESISIRLKDGRNFLNRDITSAPLGEDGRVVSCFDGKDIVIFPMQDVLEVRFHPKET